MGEAAAMISSRVSPARLANPVFLRLAPSASTGLSSGVAGRGSTTSQDRCRPSQAHISLLGWGGQPVPRQRHLLPTEEPAQPFRGTDAGVGVVGALLVVEGELGAAAAGAVPQPGRHRWPGPGPRTPVQLPADLDLVEPGQSGSSSRPMLPTQRSVAFSIAHGRSG